MTRATIAPFPFVGNMHPTAVHSAVVTSIAEARVPPLRVPDARPEILALGPWAPDAGMEAFASSQSPSAVAAASRSLSSTDAGGWSIQSFSFVEANGASGKWTVIGGRPGQDPRSDLGPPTHPGTPGNDVVLGGPGRDTIAGGLGNDTLSGGGDADTFLYTVGDGSDTITDFERGVDRLVILGSSGVSLSSNGGVAVVTLDDGSQITLHSAVPAASADGAPFG